MENDKIRIQWFPGHMTKAKREMQDKMKMVDLVIELRDARIPNASKNPMIEELIQQKPRLIILSKKDKADAAITKAWIQTLSNASTMVLALDIITENITPKIVKAVQTLMQAKIERMIRRGMKPRAMRAMVVGVPKSLQWSKINKDLELLDTPGVLWPKFEDERVGILLAITGAIRDEILPLEEIAAWAMRYLLQHHAQALTKRYDIALCSDPYEMLNRIAQKRGYMRNHEIDEKRTIETFLRELRDDKLGPISWEVPDAV